MPGTPMEVGTQTRNRAYSHSFYFLMSNKLIEKYDSIRNRTKPDHLKYRYKGLKKLILKFVKHYTTATYDELLKKFKQFSPQKVDFSITELELEGFIRWLIFKLSKSNNRITFNEFYCRKNDEAFGKSKLESSETLKKTTLQSNKHLYDAVDEILQYKSFKTRKNELENYELKDLLEYQTFKERLEKHKFVSFDDNNVRMFCKYRTMENCRLRRSEKLSGPCRNVHLKRIIQKQTDINVGDCSFLNACFHSSICKFVHYEINKNYKDYTPPKGKFPSMPVLTLDVPQVKLYPPQWVRCDLRYFDVGILGKFDIIMADPAWDIHMELPYGTMSDVEMMNLPVHQLQDEGFIFLWVTGRAMELGRECLKRWGYERCDEIIWVKVNQLQRLIRTGRTGHWLNHGKEHCLVGKKGQPTGYNQFIDCDVIVCEVRDTSHKPDEIYALIERMWPNSRKIGAIISN
ncbi:N6-adenosine-methyltransferase 70 kDa subunit [Thelohanellus kitauei]|uniref:mRNA m(6)A methyltransferase n=1 Tax=Thelohanellus kitauei TaxID=669202 RepID=A0A0C2IXC1_THEKT|nr:N6-adenosine-methyltransferase 70 kDa subunit [Thelohanellus kitauei]